MVNRLLLLLCLSMLTVTANGQIVRGVGVKLGPTASDVRFPDLDGIPDDTVRRFGVAAMAYVEWLDVPAFSVVTEVGYVARGYATEHEGRDAQNNPTGTFRIDTRLDYLTTALLAKVRMPGATAAPYVLAGPRLDFYIEGSTEPLTVPAEYAPTAFGPTFGLGVEASRVLPIAIFGEMRYSFDMTNSLPDVPRDAYNDAIDLLVGVRF